MPTPSRPLAGTPLPAATRSRAQDARLRWAARSIRVRRGFAGLLGLFGLLLGLFGRALIRLDLVLLLLILVLGGLGLWADRRAGHPAQAGGPRIGPSPLLAFALGYGLGSLLLALAAWGPLFAR